MSKQLLVFDLEAMPHPADLANAGFKDAVSVRLAYATEGDLPKRLVEQLTKKGADSADVTYMVGSIMEVYEMEGSKEVNDARFRVMFGADAMTLDCMFKDLVPVARVEERDLFDVDKAFFITRRRQYKAAHEEALQRRAEGSEPNADEASVMEERMDIDPTGSGEGGVPPMDDLAEAVAESDRFQEQAERMADIRQDSAGVYRLNYDADTLPNAYFDSFGEGWTKADAVKARGTIEDTEEENGVKTFYVEFVRESDGQRAMVPLRRDDLVLVTHEFAVPESSPGQGAPFITKVYLDESAGPILINGEARMVAEALEEGDGFVWFQVVNRDGIVSWDEVALRYSKVKSVKSDNEAL